MGFTLQTLNAFEMTRRTAACEIAATRLDHRAFVAVYPPLPDKDVHKWRIRKFEIPRHILEEYFGEGDLVDSQLLRVDTLEEVEEVLSAWNIDPAMLDAPWKCAYPL